MTNQNHHGLSIGIQRSGRDFYVKLTAIGTLTSHDYDVITPLIDAALGAVQEPRVKMFIDATQLDGWELGAAWDDLKLGLKHGHEFTKIAIHGNKTWLKMASKIGSWFISGEMKFFEDGDEALIWLAD
jgi:hypothetical protein